MKQTFQRTRHTWLLYLALAIYSFALNALGPVTPFLKAELNLSYAVSSLHFSAFAVGMILAGLSGQLLAARMGRKRLMWLGLFGMCASELGLLVGREVWMTICASFFMGCIGSLALTVIPSGLSDEHGEARSIALSESNVIASISSAAAPLMIGWFSYSFLGWRFALALPLVTALALYLAMGKTPLLSSASAGAAANKGGKLPARYWVYWVAIFFAVAAEFCMVSWCADYLENAAGLPKAVAAQAVSVFLVGMIIGRFSGSRVLQRFSAYQVVTVSLLVSALGFVLFWIASVAWLAVAGLFITGIGIASQYPLILSLALGAADGNTGQASSWAALASGIAIFALPLSLGRLADSLGIRPAYGVVLVLMLATFVLIQLTGRRPIVRMPASFKAKEE